jgi:putative acetyltransferase
MASKTTHHDRRHLLRRSGRAVLIASTPLGCGPNPIQRFRRALPADRHRLVEVWLNSVCATHHFLTEADIQALLVLVRDVVLPNLEEIWLVCDDDDVALGFMGLDGQSLEALFIDPSHFGCGAGRCLVEHARRLKGPLHISVNEQNPAAIGFYAALGFEVVGRSPVDDAGRPFPLLHMRDAAG